MRILLADDHALVRAGLKSLIAAFDGCEVVAEASDGDAAIAMADRHRPDVVILDVSMPGLNGLEAARQILARHAGMRVVMLSMHTVEHYQQEAFRAGALAYVLKDAAPEELEQALACVSRGESYLSPSVRAASRGDVLASLTSRQVEILRLIASGLSTREIAEQLGISVKTVETHRAQLSQRLGISDVAGLTRLALRCGLIVEP